jgi:hypothetical protein
MGRESPYPHMPEKASIFRSAKDRRATIFGSVVKDVTRSARAIRDGNLQKSVWPTRGGKSITVTERKV